MEERFRPPPSPPSTAVAPTDDNRQLPQHRLYRVDHDSVALQIVLPNSNDTYIIQMPKDQIYRVPPPENAAVVERYSQPPQKARRQCSPCACYTASALFAVAVIALVIFLIYKFTLSPKHPLFVIKSFSVVDGNSNPNYHKSASAHHAPTTYDVGIRATNPNAVNSLVYVAGTAELVLNGKEVAKGQSPAVSQAGKQIDEFEVALAGHGAAVPKAAGKRRVKLNLRMSLHMKKKTWLTDHTDLVLVECEFVVDSLPPRKGSAIVKSQSCGYL